MRKVLMLLGLLFLPASGEEVVLTLQQALQRATSEHPQLRAAEARERQAQIGENMAGALPPAQLGVGSWQGSGDTLLNANYIAQNRGDYYLFVQQQFRPPGQGESRQKLASSELEGARAQLAGTRLQLAQQVKDAFYSLLAAERQLALTRQNFELGEELYRVTSVRLKAGSSPRMDQLNASIQRNRADQDVQAASQQVLQARARLAPLVGLPADTSIRCEAELATRPTLPDLPALRELIATHPRLQSARAALEASRHQRELAEQQGGPVPGIQAVYDAVRPSYAVQFTLTVPLDWGSLGGEVDQRREQEREREELLQAESRQLEGELTSSYYGYLRAREQVSSYEEKILQPAEELVQVTRYGYERGALPYFQLLTVQQQLSSLRREYVQRWLESHLALDALELAAGRLFE